jgi:hypothetical protein
MIEVMYMKVFVDIIKDISDYDDESKWVDYGLLMYLQARLISKCFVNCNNHRCTISLNQMG